MIVETDGFSFDFTDALDAYVFDEKDPAEPRFHGLPMKAVDIVVELEEKYLYIELKHMDDPDQYNIRADVTDEKRKAFKWLKNYLKYKYRDTFLARYAEEKVDKPIPLLLSHQFR